MKAILKEIAGVTLGTIAVITVLLWVLILSGHFDVETLLAKSTAPAAPDKPSIVSSGPATPTGYGYWDRKKERGQ